MDKLIDRAMDLYFTPFAITTEKKFKKIRENPNLTARDLEKYFLHVTNLDAIISTTSLMKLKINESIEIEGKDKKRMIVCTIDDNKENKQILKRAKKEQIEFEEGMCGETLNV